MSTVANAKELIVLDKVVTEKLVLKTDIDDAESLALLIEKGLVEEISGGRNTSGTIIRATNDGRWKYFNVIGLKPPISKQPAYIKKVIKEMSLLPA